MRRTLLLPLVAFLACTSSKLPPPPPSPESLPPTPLALTIEQEAEILRLEDTRTFDPAVMGAWAASPNRLQRERIALALGRIGPHVFVDANGNRERDADERQAGVDQLAALATDPEAPVRLNTAFALGEIGDAAGVTPLFVLAADADPVVAAEAAEALAKLGAQTPLARYLELTTAAGGRSEAVRVRALQFLFRFNSDEASAAAMAALDDRSAAIREAAAYALSRRAYAPARERLELMMTDPATLTRAYATAALGRIGAKESVPALIVALLDLHPWVRTNAAVALGRMAAKDASILSSDHLPRLFAVLEDADAGTRASAIDLLGHYAAKLEGARKRLLDVAANGTRWERELAAGAIARHFGPGALPENLTAWQRVRVLEAGSDKPWGVDLRKRWASDPDPLVRSNAIGTIPDAGVDAELAIIRTAIGDDDVVVRANALDRLAKTTGGDVEKIAVFMASEQKERKAEMNDARLAAVGGLAGLAFDGREAWLRSLLTDTDPVVRRVAADALVEKLGAKRPQIAPFAVRAVDYAEVVRWSREPHTATIKLARGDVRLALLARNAPLTAWNFAQLAKKGYFDGSSFMRVVPNFVVQGGDPRNDMNGGPGYAIRDEINLEKYTRGAVGMALSGPDTGGSQFFITHSPQPHLDGGYTIFGRVIANMSGVVDQIERGDKVETVVIDDGKPATAEQLEGPQHTPLPLTMGPMNLDAIMKLPEYETRKAEYKPDVSLLGYMATMVHADDRIEVYMGTWCPDSQREIPHFLRILDLLAAQGKALPVSWVAVDRSKGKPADLIAGKSIEKVPTFIYYRGAQELGRIVEKPTALLEDDLLALASR